MAITLITSIAVGFGAAIGTTAVFSWAAFAISAGFSLVARALTPKPDLGVDMGGQSVMTRDPAQSRKIIYGRTRVGANVVYLESTGEDNKYLWLVGAVAAHEIDAYEQVWFGDEKIWDSTQGYYDNWNSRVEIRFFTGDQTVSDNATDSTTISPRTDNLVNASNNKWTTDHKLLDTAYMVIRLEHDVDKFSSGLPNISTVIRGKKVLDLTNSTTAGSFVVGTKYKILSLSNSGTATNFTAIGAASNTVGLEFRATGVGTGTGQARIFSWSQNNALCLYDYLRDAKYGLGEIDDNILISSVITAKGVCDQPISLLAGGNQPRYTINGVVDTVGTLKSNIEIITGSMAGRLVYSGGKFEIHAGQYVAPAFTVDASQIVGDITVQTKQSRRNVFNGVKGVFLSEDDNYVLSDYPAQISSTFAAQDGDPIYLDMALPFTTGNIRAQRLAKLALLRSRQEEAITIPCNLSALRFKIGDNINVNYPDFGYVAKIFEVVGYSLSLGTDGQIIVNVQAIETAANIWNWATSDEEVFLDGGTVELYDGKVAQPPASVSVAGDTFIAADGTTSSFFNVTWPTSVDAFVDRYVVEWAITEAAGSLVVGKSYEILTVGNTSFTSIGASANTVGVIFTATGVGSGSGIAVRSDNYLSQETRLSPFVITNIESLKVYYVRVKAINELGVSSIYKAAQQTAAIDTTAPSVPSSISATAGYKSISLAWTNPSQTDFNNVEIYRSTSSNGTYADVSNLSGGFGAKVEHLDGGLADATAFYYKLKSVDSSGNKSAFSGVVNATTNAAAINGSDGKSTFTAPIFKRATSAPSTPTGGTFNFGTNTLTAPTGWSTTVPSGTNPIYQANFQFSISGDTGTVTAGTWSTPVVIAENGDNGTDGLSTFVFPVYKRSDGAPTAPSGGSYNFTNNTINAPSGWSSSVPSGTDPIYVSTTQAQISGATGTDSSLTWTSPILFVQNGISGSDGKSTFTAPIFKRATSAPSAPSGGTFNFSNNTLTPPSGWAIAVPSGTNPIYQANFQFSISGDTGTVTAGTWSTPVIIAENGEDGTDGLSTFTFAVHKRSSSTPSAPSGGSYNFGTNAITAPSGWSATIPSGTDPIYISSTRAQISGATGTDSSLSWTSPIVFAINGDNGDDGVNTAPVYAYKRSSSALASSNKPTTTRTWTFANASFGNNDLGNGWTGDIPTGTDDLYICAAVASSTGTTDSVVAADWSAPQILGTKGDNGVNTAVVYGYKRSASTVTDKPSTTRTWTFSTGTFNNNDLGNSFTGEIPSGTNELYVCTAVASSVNSTDSVAGTSDWSAPQLLAAEGTDGTDGFNTAVVYGYKRSSSTVTDKPSTTRTWTFSNASFNNNDLGNSFTAVIPSGTNNLYACTAVAKSQSSTDSVAGTSDWSAPQLLSSNGSTGAAGVRNAAGYVYNSQTSANAPSAPTASAYNFGTGVFTDLTSNWSRTPPINTGGDAKYWATSYYVTEATYNGTQSLNFGTVFNSVTFDGLVTFTNLNSALANDGGNVTTIDGGLITTDSIVVSKLSGDVTESYPLMLYPNLALSNSVQTVSSFSIPVPSLGISKRQKLAFNTKITIRNTNNSAVGTYAIRMDVQKKSKGVNAVSVGTVTVVSFASFVGVLYVSGNKLGIVDGAGGIADSASPSGVSNVQGVYYDLATNRTYITYSDQFNRFSNGETAYYSDSKFTSAGTWVTPSSGIAYQIRTPSGTNSFEDVNIPIDLFFGSSTTGTDFRIRMFVVQNLSGFTFTLAYMRGFMENTA